MGANGRNGTWHWVRLGVGVCITVANSALRGPTQLPSLCSDSGRPSARLSKVEHTEVGGTHWIALLGKEPRAMGTAKEAMPNQVEAVGWLWSRVTFKLSGSSSDCPGHPNGFLDYPSICPANRLRAP